MTEKLAIIADDFTGSNDTGVQFSKKGLETRVIFDKSNIENASKESEVIVIDTESRAIKSSIAQKKVKKATKSLREQGVKYIYKKLDSTLRGNIGSEIEGAMDGGGFEVAIVAPAMPANGRKTIGGNQLVYERPLEKTEIAEDPVSPVNESYIPNIISKQTDRKVDVINLKDVIKGKDNLLKVIMKKIEENNEILVIDAIDKNDLNNIALSVAEMKKACLMVGSAGFAESLPENLQLTKNKEEKSHNGSIVGVVGSVSDITREQIKYAQRKLNNVQVEDVNLENILSDEFQKEINRLMDIHDKNNINFIIRSASEREMVNKAYKIGERYNLNKSEVSKKIAQFMGEVAKFVFFDETVKGLFLTGGDIAIESASVIGARASMIKDEVLPGVPLSYFSGSDLPNKPVVTKAGAFGDKKSIVEIFEFLRKW